MALIWRTSARPRAARPPRAAPAHCRLSPVVGNGAAWHYVALAWRSHCSESPHGGGGRGAVRCGPPPASPAKFDPIPLGSAGWMTTHGWKNPHMRGAAGMADAGSRSTAWRHGGTIVAMASHVAWQCSTLCGPGWARPGPRDPSPPWPASGAQRDRLATRLLKLLEMLRLIPLGWPFSFYLLPAGLDWAWACAGPPDGYCRWTGHRGHRAASEGGARSALYSAWQGSPWPRSLEGWGGVRGSEWRTAHLGGVWISWSGAAPMAAPSRAGPPAPPAAVHPACVHLSPRYACYFSLQETRLRGWGGRRRAGVEPASSSTPHQIIASVTYVYIAEGKGRAECSQKGRGEGGLQQPTRLCACGSPCGCLDSRSAQPGARGEGRRRQGEGLARERG